MNKEQLDAAAKDYKAALDRCSARIRLYEQLLSEGFPGADTIMRLSDGESLRWQRHGQKYRIVHATKLYAKPLIETDIATRMRLVDRLPHFLEAVIVQARRIMAQEDV